MEEQSLQPLNPAPVGPPVSHDIVMGGQVTPVHHRIATIAPSLRDILALFFRHRLLILSSFLGIFLGVVLWTWVTPKKYEAHVKILVNRERPSPLLVPESGQPNLMARDVTPEDLNSETELIKSRDLLERVVVTCGLHTIHSDSPINRLLSFVSGKNRGSSAQDLRIPRAVQTLEMALAVELIPKSKLIEVRYEAQDPQLAAKVLETLSGLYLEKHLTVHRPPGAVNFFQQQADQYQKGLATAEQRLAEFNRKKGVVSIEIERDIALRRLGEFEAQLRETQTAEAATEQRIKALEKQLASRPPRVVTQVHTSDNTVLLQELKSTLLGLQMKRTELLTKYEPGYRAVQEVDAQIAQAREALSQAEKNSLRDETTDLDRTTQWLDEELARARAELVTLKARSEEIAKSVELYRQSAREISGKEIEHEDLVRSAKTAEENYLLYLRKQEEGRISDELDRKRIVNVAIAEAATVPALPSSPRWGLNLILGFVLALLASFGSAFAVDYMDPSFRTPDEVEAYLGVPVLAAMPRA